MRLNQITSWNCSLFLFRWTARRRRNMCAHTMQNTTLCVVLITCLAQLNLRQQQVDSNNKLQLAKISNQPFLFDVLVASALVRRAFNATTLVTDESVSISASRYANTANLRWKINLFNAFASEHIRDTRLESSLVLSVLLEHCKSVFLRISRCDCSS